MARFSVTYELVGYEEAEIGETDRRGFVEQDCCLREAVKLVGGIAYEADSYPLTTGNGPRWLTNYEYDEDFRTGDRESRSLHMPDHLTKATRLRIARLLGVRGA